MTTRIRSSLFSVLGPKCKGKQRSPRSDCSLRSSLIRVCCACHLTIYCLACHYQNRSRRFCFSGEHETTKLSKTKFPQYIVRLEVLLFWGTSNYHTIKNKVPTIHSKVRGFAFLGNIKLPNYQKQSSHNT